ncbi:TPA: Mor transcription activator family protein [Providencia alcalifaciens]|uniref:mor transcription activator family protein n=2 Tax=Providencia alcalifaciens TaxID=126385 RepID=UPI001CC759D2|nr:mor transcription activator family protein [Providencia alcalifaciens]
MLRGDTKTMINKNELVKFKTLLPDSAKQLIDVIGYTATSKLINQFGGVSLTGISHGATERTGGVHRLLEEILNDNEYKKLLQYIGQSVFYIPRCKSIFRQIRNQQFLSEFTLLNKQGYSRRQAMALLCPKYGFSDRIGWKLLHDLNKD